MSKRKGLLIRQQRPNDRLILNGKSDVNKRSDREAKTSENLDRKEQPRRQLCHMVIIDILRTRYPLCIELVGPR